MNTELARIEARHRIADARMRGEQVREEAEKRALGLGELLVEGALVGLLLILMLVVVGETVRRARKKRSRSRRHR